MLDGSGRQLLLLRSRRCGLGVAIERPGCHAALFRKQHHHFISVVEVNVQPAVVFELKHGIVMTATLMSDACLPSLCAL